MAKVEDALRDLIVYHGRRAAREVLGDLPDQVRELRREVREISRTLEQMTSDVGELMEVRREQMAVPPAPEEEIEKARFSKRTLKSIRRRYDLTAEELAELLEVSPATIAAWEGGRSRPRAENLARIVTLRQMDKEQIDEALGRRPVTAEYTADDVKKLRSKLELTQAELAKLAGVSTSAVTSWESGRTSPTRENREALDRIRALSRAEVDARLGREAPATEAPAPEPTLAPDRIKAIRQAAGLSQRELARRLGVSANSVSNWETGRTAPRRASAEALLAL